MRKSFLLKTTFVSEKCSGKIVNIYWNNSKDYI